MKFRAALPWIKMNLSWHDWKQWKRVYWLCLILLAVINVMKGRTTAPAFLGHRLCLGHCCRMVVPEQTVALGDPVLNCPAGQRYNQSQDALAAHEAHRALSLLRSLYQMF